MGRTSIRLVLAVAALAGVALGTAAGAAPAAADDVAVAARTDTVVPTHFYDLRKRVFALPSATPWVTSLGGSQVLAFGADADLTGSALLGGRATAYPMYAFDVGSGVVRTLGAVDLASIVGADSWTRILDVQNAPELRTGSDRRDRVLVSLATYSAQTGCRRLIVNEVLVDRTGGGANALGRRWFTMPCIRPFTPTEGTWLVGPGLHQSGGRVAVVPKAQWADARRPEIYVTTGDFAVLANLGAQVPRSTRRLMSDVLRVPTSGPVTVVASGIRNPQGLTTAVLDGRRSLVATTHGPRGGDELLDVRPGDDYGWPRESYGTVYDYAPTATQSKPQVEGRLPTATKPAFSWLPSIAPSAVVQVLRNGVLAPWWGSVRGRPTGDLLVSGMVPQQLYRIRWDDGAVRYVEPIDVGVRIRSLTQTSTGVLVAGIDTAGPDAGTVVVLDPVRAWSSATSSLS